jgi:hypothetical protein
MSMDDKSSRLDAERLNEIVSTLDLGEADNLDRLRVWYQDVLRELWAWIKTTTGGEDGWLNRFGETLQDWLRSIGGQDVVSAEGVLDVLYYASFAILLGLLIWCSVRLWQMFRPDMTSNQEPLSYAPLDPELAMPLSALPVSKWAPAMFNQVCIVLANQQRLHVGLDATNAAIVRDARLDKTQRQDLAQLAKAADLALFGGWVPSAEELKSLRALTDQLLDNLRRSER